MWAETGQERGRKEGERGRKAQWTMEEAVRQWLPPECHTTSHHWGSSRPLIILHHITHHTTQVRDVVGSDIATILDEARRRNTYCKR